MNVSHNYDNTQVFSYLWEICACNGGIFSYNTKYMSTYETQAASEKVNLDEKDRKILRLLIDEPRISVADIARQVGVQRDTVTYRMKRFENKGLILKYHVVIDSVALGLDIFMMVLIQTAPVGQETLDEFIAGLMQHKNVTHVAKTVGKYDFMLYVAASDMLAFDKVLTDIKSIKEGIIKELEPIAVPDAYKIDDFSALV